MTRLAYHLLDVFAEEPFAGNPLAVVPAADGLTPARMQAIAREFNLSETAFVLAPRDPVHTARLRIFTPTTELSFAGHPTIGAACLIASLRAPDVIGRQPLQIVLEEPAGAVVCEATRFKNVLRGSFIPPQPPALGGVLPHRGEIAGALGLGEAEIGFDAHQPAIASAGLPFAFVPVNSLQALSRLTPDFGRFSAAFGREPAGVFVYAPETADPAHHVQARVFASGVGVTEDPATGSAAAAFAAVAVHFERPENGEHDIVIEQGFAIGRPSHIGLTLRVAGGVLAETSVGGACVKIGEGVLSF